MPVLSGCTLFPTTTGTGGTGSNLFNVAPSAIISTNLVRGVAPFLVEFSSERSTDDGVIVERRWTFGDGSDASSEIAPTHLFIRTGTFTVRLTVTDDRGATDTETITISVTEAPVAVISVDRTAAEFAPAIFNFNAGNSFDPDGEVVSYEWDFGDGSSETLQLAPHTYTRPGTYRVRLRVTDDVGVTSTTSTTVQVGIRVPTIEFRVPSADVDTIVTSPQSPLWAQVVFNLEPGVSRTLRAGLDGDLDVCDAQAVTIDFLTGLPIRVLDGPLDQVTDAKFSPDGKQVVAASRDGTISIYDVESGGLIRVVDGDAGVEVLCVEWAPDGDTIAFGQSDGQIHIVGVDGTPTLTIGHTDAVNGLGYSAGGSRLASASSDGTVIVWSLPDGTVLRQFNHPDVVNDAAISPVDSTLVATACEDGVVRVWDTSTGGVVFSFTDHTDAANAVAYSFDGALLLSGSDDNTAILYSLDLGVVTRKFEGHDGDVLAVAFAANNKAALTGSADGDVRRFSIDTGQVTDRYSPCSSPITAVSDTLDGDVILAGVGARTAVQLDTNPRQGNDIDLRFPSALSLADVPALDGAAVEPGTYFFFAEIDTDITPAVRTYSSAVVIVVDDFTTTVTADTPRVPLVDDAAKIVLPSGPGRRVLDLGPVSEGDQVNVSYSHTPGYDEYFKTEDDSALVLLDDEQDIFAWVTQRGPDQVVSAANAEFPEIQTLFNQNTRFVVADDSDNLFVVVDGGASLNVKINRGVGHAPVTQRVFLDFDDATELTVGIHPTASLEALSGPALGLSLGLVWSAADTDTIKAEAVNRLRAIFAAYDIEFSTSDDAPPAPPFTTIHIGVGASQYDVFGVADFIDPRNNLRTGTGVVFATEIAEAAFAGLQPAIAPITIPEDMGGAIANTAAHVLGSLLGLRGTSTAGDIMQIELRANSNGVMRYDIADPTDTRTVTEGVPSIGEQIGGIPVGLVTPQLDPIGVQDADKILLGLVGAP
ncbi:MAG: PKD domain-containing protein [Phycisphaerales bacterium]|nr:PKD domain-containing protein [Phycisphaerales bacterium]